MSADDVLFEKIGTTPDTDAYREQVWQFYLENLPPEINVKKLLQEMDKDEIELCKKFVFSLLKSHGNPTIDSAEQLKEIMNVP